jgi:S-adenosylmethionine decarboxylase
MTQADTLRSACLDAVAAAGLTAVNECFHAFPARADQGPSGITGVVLLAESHLTVHTWPEKGVVTLDIFVCNLQDDNTSRAQQLLQTLLAGFQPGAQSVQTIRREIPEADKT